MLTDKQQKLLKAVKKTKEFKALEKAKKLSSKAYYIHVADRNSVDDELIFTKTIRNKDKMEEALHKTKEWKDFMAS